LQYCYSAEQRVVLSTGIGIPLKYWNRKTGRISKDLPLVYGDVQTLDTSITEKLRKAEDMVTYDLKQRDTCPMKFISDNFHLNNNWKLEQMSDAEKNLDVYWNIDDYVESKRSIVKRCTINVMNAMKAHLKSFECFRKNDNF